MKEEKTIPASLTIEASLVLPIFLFFYMMFICFIQIFLVQEVLQEAITEAGLSMSRAAYIFSDFRDVTDIEEFDSSLLEENIKEALSELAKSTINSLIIKYSVANKLDINIIDNSCIVGGLEGIRFDGSQVMQGDRIDIIIRYRIRIPINFFGLKHFDMIQRVNLRGWTGHQLPALYKVTEEDDGEDKTSVYITETGTVYHLSKTCSHIKLSIETIDEKPTWQRNKNGGKYYPCESCCADDLGASSYYITSYGDRYHSNRDCSGIKRTVKEVSLDKVGSRTSCKRCGK
ncbi:MAG: pilus assembly protein [Clostridiales bacterium]|nr:pilus assembly protein [Clostridiales bacterium]